MSQWSLKEEHSSVKRDNIEHVSVKPEKSIMCPSRILVDGQIGKNAAEHFFFLSTFSKDVQPHIPIEWPKVLKSCQQAMTRICDLGRPLFWYPIPFFVVKEKRNKVSRCQPSQVAFKDCKPQPAVLWTLACKQPCGGPHTVALSRHMGQKLPKLFDSLISDEVF